MVQYSKSKFMAITKISQNNPSQQRTILTQSKASQEIQTHATIKLGMESIQENISFPLMKIIQIIMIITIAVITKMDDEKQWN